MSGHQTSPEAQGWIDFLGTTQSMRSIADTHHDYMQKSGGGGAGGSGDAGGMLAYAAPGGQPAQAAPAKLQVRVFAEQAVTMGWMRKFDQFNDEKSQAVEIPGKGRLSRQQFLDTYVVPVGKQVRHAIKVVQDMNDGSLEEAAKVPKNVADTVKILVNGSKGNLDRAGGGLDSGRYVTAYAQFVHALNQAMRARAEIGAYDKKAIDDADRMVTALEITRDTGFFILSVAMPEHVILIGIAGAVVKGADDWAGGKDFKTVGFEVVLNILLSHLGDKVGGAIVKSWGPTLERWLNNAFGSLIESGISNSPILRSLANWAATQPEAEMRSACVKIMAGNKLSPAEAKPIIDGLRRYIAEKHLVNAMLKKAVEMSRDVVNTFGKVCYHRMTTAGENLSFKDSCLKLLEEIRSEMAKDSQAKSDLLWSILSKVANAV